MKTSLRWPPFLLLLGIALCSQSPATEPGRNAEAVALCEKAEQLSEAEQLDSALVCARNAAALAENAKDWQTWGKAQTILLGVCYGLGQYAEAAATFPTLEQKAQAAISADSSFWGSYYNAAGAISYMLGNYEAALKYGLQEIAFFEKSGSPMDLITAYNNAGNYYRGRGDFDRALEYTQAALQACLSDTATSNDDLAWTYSNLSKIWYRKKDFPRAVAYGEKALAVLAKHSPGENPLQFIQTCNDLSNAHTELKSYEKALAYLQKALRVFEQSGLDYQIDLTWHNVGYVYAMMGNYPKAVSYLQRAVKSFGPRHPDFGRACRNMGLVAQRQGDLRGALRWQQQALYALTDSFPDQDILANPAVQRVNAYTDFFLFLGEKAETLRLLGKKESNPVFLEASLATFDIAASVLDSIRAEYQEGSRQFLNREMRPIVEGAISTALQINQETGDAKYLEQAFRYAEKNKSLLLAEALRESAAKQKAGIPNELLQQEKDLKIDIAFYKRQIFKEQQKTAVDTSKILLWQKEILERHRAYEALLTDLKNLYPAYYQIKYSQPPLSITPVQQGLPANCGLIEYFAGDSAIYVFYINRNSANGMRLMKDTSFNGQLENFINNLRNREQVLEQGRSQDAIARYAKNAAALYASLLAPVSIKIPEQLIIIPDGNLSYLPFELLLTQNADRTDSYAHLPYLLQKAVVRYEYSATLALQPLADKKPQSQFMGYAPGYANGLPVTTRGENTDCREAVAADFAALDNNQTEVSQIARLLGGKALLGDLATETHFRQHASEPRILHLAMHGFLNDCDPLYSGLVFRQQSSQDSLQEEADGFLHAYEIYNMHLNAELAVLSACNTGRGQLAKGEGVISLARAFKYAGCSNVLMSLWQADDQATAKIMQGFYQYLKEGKGKDAAIRQAKLDYLGADNRNHPFFWGAFVLIGDDQPMTQPSIWIWYVLGMLLLAGLGVAYWSVRRRA